MPEPTSSWKRAWQAGVAVCCAVALLGQFECMRQLRLLLGPLPQPPPGTYALTVWACLLAGVLAGSLGRLEAALPWALLPCFLVGGDAIQYLSSGLQPVLVGWWPRVMLVTGAAQLLACLLVVAAALVRRFGRPR